MGRRERGGIHQFWKDVGQEVYRILWQAKKKAHMNCML